MTITTIHGEMEPKCIIGNAVRSVTAGAAVNAYARDLLIDI